MPRERNTGDTGITKISVDPSGAVIFKKISADIPKQKEEAEMYFAERFISFFNKNNCIDGVRISDFSQNNSDDIDFKITCEIANYLELAETTPLNTDFGKKGFEDGKFCSIEYGDWIFNSIIKKKSNKYGLLSNNIILLIYQTHEKFQLSQFLIEYLCSLCSHNIHNFKAIFIFMTTGGSREEALEITEKIWPLEKSFPSPDSYPKSEYINLNIF
jgi:hypothetical protein